MRLRTLVTLAILAVAMGGAYYAVEMRGREAREEAARAERRLVNFDPARVREIAIEKPDERIVVKAYGAGWRITAPVDEAADDSVVDGLLSFVRGLEKVRSLDGVRDLATVGLDRPTMTLGFGVEDGERLTLLLGGPNPARTGIYAAIAGAPAVFLAPARLGAELGKSPYLAELRDRTILA